MSIYFFLSFVSRSLLPSHIIFCQLTLFWGRLCLLLLLRWIPFSCFFLNQTIRNLLFIFYFTIIVRKKPTTTGGKLSPVGASLTNPLLMPRHLPMQTSPPGGGGGIESRRACDVVFELGAKPQIPKGSLILF